MQNNIIFSKKIEVLKKLNMFLMSWHHYFFLKMRFKGKIYKVKRTKKKKLKLSFGRSHKTIVILKNLFLKKRKKQKHKFFFISSNLNELKQSASIIKNVRPINMFTQRGLRLSRQIIYKKIGKKSSYLNKK